MNDVHLPWPGSWYPLGATADDDGVNFAVWANGAAAVEVCLFDGDAETAVPTAASAPSTSGTATCPACGPGQRYGFRVHGPWDPRARRPLQPGQAAPRPLRAGDRRRAALRARDLRPRPQTTPYATTRDSAPFVPRSVVVRDAFDWGTDAPPETPWADTDDLRGARPGLHPAAPGRPRGAAWHVRRPRAPGGGPAPRGPRRHGRRAVAGAPLRQRAAPRRATG